MLKVTCVDVGAAMRPELRERVMDLLVDRGTAAAECAWEGVAASADALMDQLTDHVKAQHAMRAWPPEYWVHIRSCIRPVE